MSVAVLHRIAIVTIIIGVLAAAAATFAPTREVGSSCGTWLDPEWPEDEVRELLERYGPLAEQDLSGEIAGEASGSMRFLIEVHAACEESLGTRRTMTFVALGLTVVIPLALLFVGGAVSRRDEPPS